MGLQNLLHRLQRRASDTSEELAGDPPEPSTHAGCTPDTSSTPPIGDTVANNDTAPDPDRWCWPHSEGRNTAEIEIFTVRLIHFASRGAAGAEALADRLVQRDREADTRNLCVECQLCHAGPRCRRGLPVLDVLQRCDYFVGYPELERPSP